jgi:hypothetical protein
LIKYKYFERTYENDTKEYELLSKLYMLLVKDLKLNLKSETILIQSDLMFNFILSTGTMFISDVRYILKRVFFIPAWILIV